MNKTVLLFITVLFVISWPSYFVLKYLDNPIAYFLIVALWFMPSPTYSILFLKFVLGRKIDFDISFKKINPQYLLITPSFVFLYILLVIGTVYFFGNLLNIDAFGFVSFEDNLVASTLEKFGGESPLNGLKWYYLIPLVMISGTLSGLTINMLFAFTEELAWRDFLIRELKDYSIFRANIIIGVLWGFWHTPVILLGHNLYGYPLWGVMLMISFCVVMSFLLYYLRVKGESVWVPSIFHGTLNGTAGIILVFIHDGNMLFSNPVGVAGIIAVFTLLMVIFAIKSVNPFNSIRSDLEESIIKVPFKAETRP